MKTKTDKKHGDVVVGSTDLLGSVVPWVGKLSQDHAEFADWGRIRDDAGSLIMIVNLPFSPYGAEAAGHRRNKTDPTQPRVDALLASVNAIDAIRELCTTDHESKEAFIRRVLLCLPNAGYEPHEGSPSAPKN